MYKKLPKAPSWEEGYYVGKEFIEDKKRIDCRVEARFYSPAVIDNFNFWLYKTEVDIEHKQFGLFVSFDYKISNKLLHYIKNNLRGGNDERFILAIISKFLPRINYELLSQRYLKGHPLARVFSVFNISQIIVTRKKSGEKIYLSWPSVIGSFPPVQNPGGRNKEIFFRDWIDAMHLYFDNNFDDCIRKIITSVENFFEFKKFRGRRKFLVFRPKKFIGIVKKNIYSNKELPRKVITSNLILVYKTRNKIVHGNSRLSYKSNLFCRKAIHTLFYLYQLVARDQNMVSYAFSLGQQFFMIDAWFCHPRSLEDIEKTMEKTKTQQEKDEIAKISSEDFDDYMFEQIRIKKKEAQLIKF